MSTQEQKTSSVNLFGLTNQIGISEINPDMLINNYLTGLEDLFVDKEGIPWPNSWWWWRLSKGVERVEEGANITLMPRKRVEFHDYKQTDYIQFAYIELWHAPVLSVEKVSAVYPVTGPPISQTGIDDRGVIIDFPIEWVRLYPGGKLHIVPTAGTLSQVLLGKGGSYLPLIYNHLSYLPQLWKIEYTAGFQNLYVPFIIADAVFKAAAIEALTVLSDSIRPPGTTNMEVSFDGLSRRYSFEKGDKKAAAMFTSRIN